MIKPKYECKQCGAIVANRMIHWVTDHEDQVLDQFKEVLQKKLKELRAT
jgi:hypothetical protein